MFTLLLMGLGSCEQLTMDRNDPEKRSGNEARDDDQVMFCPTCASQPRLRIAILDSRKGKTVRVFECRCGEIIWDD
jgi:formate dehydrogenase maturation protein FdhE